MRRPYTLNTYARLLDRVHRRLPDAALGTDVIVGFPGEDDGDFRVMADYLERSPLSYVHVFPYSKRPGTRAAALSGQIPGSVVRARTAEIRRITTTLASRFRSAQVGKVREGLTIEDGSLVVTDNYLKVCVPSGCPRNERVRVRIVADGRPMRGEIVG
jgi:threonylcarbamoyladenosine tRNA methylthiotransferase MtaB